MTPVFEYRLWKPSPKVIAKGEKCGLWTAMGEYRCKIFSMSGAKSYQVRCQCVCGFTQWIQNPNIVNKKTNGCSTCREKGRREVRAASV